MHLQHVQLSKIWEGIIILFLKVLVGTGERDVFNISQTEQVDSLAIGQIY